MSTTLQELKNQIDAANELGVTNITKKGGTISSDATTAEIMAEIDNLPSGGAAAPTIVREIEWDGNTEGLESVTFTIDGETMTFYKVSDGVLPYGYSDSTELFAYTVKMSDDSINTRKPTMITGYTIIGDFAIACAMFPNYESELPFVFPSTGTWFNGDYSDYYIKYVSADSQD